MKRKKVVIMISCAVLIVGGMLYAADHMDAPGVKGNDVPFLTEFPYLASPH